MSNDLARLVQDRHRQAIKRILDTKERIADPHLDKADQERLRTVIVDEIGDIVRLSTTLLSSLEDQLRDGYTMNQLWLQQIASGLGVDVPDVLEDVAGNGHAR